MKLRFRWVREDRPGARWKSLYERAWPSYRRWFLQEGDAARPDLDTCRTALRTHMAELVPMWERLVELAGGDEETARMLSLYRPAPYLSGCSQAVWERGRPFLVRNYDYHPAACEGTFLLTRWHRTRVLAASDCLWGVLDGVNEHGLVVALAFGGRQVVGDGFGIPLVLRYVLEFCRTTSQAKEVLVRVPSHMAYNVSLLDSGGERVVVQLAPDREPRVVDTAVATNHQLKVEWERHDELTRSSDRERFLEEALRDPRMDEKRFAEAFLRSPLHSSGYRRGFGTLYTALYRPNPPRATYSWPRAKVSQSIDSFHEEELVVAFDERRTGDPEG